jgi:RNA polymerase sigma-70 factor (ECF subfamily)
MYASSECPPSPSCGLGATHLATAIQRHLGAELQLYFSLVVAEAMPERLVHLVSRLDAVVVCSGPTPCNPFRDELIRSMPALRTFAFSLTGNPDRSDDLVQETLVKAWINHDRFQPGTNLMAWLFTILRNLFYSDIRKHKREVEDSDGVHGARLTTAPQQEGIVTLQRLRERLEQIPESQRTALLMVGAEGYTYEEAAVRLDCKVGTVKSRVSRARAYLSDMFGFDDAGGPLAAI